MLLLVDCGGVVIRFVVGYVLVCLGWVAGWFLGCLFLVCCGLLCLFVVLL